MRFDKIKYNGERVELQWTQKKLDDEVVSSLTSRQKPDKDFVHALAAFVPQAVDLLGLPESYEVGLRVVGLSINTEEGDGRRGLVVTCLKDLVDFNAPLVLNMPHLREADGDTSQPGDKGYLSDELVDLIADAEKAATRFVQGARAQQDLFAGAGAE